MVGAFPTVSGHTESCSDIKLHIIYRLIQPQLEQCMHSSILQDNLHGLLPDPFPPHTEQYMALQPKRTWSAEDERRRRLEEDPDAYDVGPHSVTCAGCHRPIRLNATGRYYAANWNKHKMGCKNTNAVNGANAMSAESKFTGRVAAFRVAKPTENSEPLALSRVSSASSAQVLNRIRVESARSSHLQPLAREPSSSWTDQHASKEKAAAFTRPIANSGHLDGERPRLSSLSGPLSGSHRSPNSPSGPPLRYEERECGSMDAPFREEVVHGAHYPSHGVTSLGIQRARANSTPSHHSEDAHHRIAYLAPQSTLPESSRLPDKAKRRYIEHSISDSQSYRYSPPHRHMPLVGLQKPDTTEDLDRLRRNEAPDICGPLHSYAQRWRESRGYSDLESDSTASPPGASTDQECRPQRKINSRSPKPVFQDSFDDRVLPPLNSLSLTKPSYLGSASRGVHSPGYISKVHNGNSRVTVIPGEGHSWRERTRAWVQTGTTCLPVDRLSPESVVLPPIRSVSTLALGSPTARRRRQREDGEDDDNSIGEDRPSPPKVIVLPLDPLRPSSALITDDLSMEYKHAMVRSVEDKDFSGDLTLVGNQSQSGPGVSSSARQDTPRLHPVWKWEQKGNTRSVETTTEERGSINTIC